MPDPQKPERVIEIPGVGNVAFPSTMGDAEINAAASKLYHQTNPGKEPQKESWISRATSWLPAAGGAVGGFVGGIPGAALGGAAGQGYKELIDHAAEIPGAIRDVATNLVENPKATAGGLATGAASGAFTASKEGAAQGALQAAGAGVAKAGGVMAKWLMNRATTRVSAQLMRDFPQLSDTLISNALTVSKGGYERAYSLLMAAKGRANFALQKAAQGGATIPVQMSEDVAQSLKTALLERAVKSGGISKAAPGEALTVASQRLDPAMADIFKSIDAAAEKGTAANLTPVQADLLKTQLQKESRALYANRVAPNGQKAVGMDATERAEFATRLNEMIDAIAPGYKAANTEAKPLIGAVRGIKQAIRPNGNLYQAMVRPAVGGILGEEAGRRKGGMTGAVVGGVAGAAMTSPAGMSREAIILASPVVQAALKQLPRATAQALRSFLGEQLSGAPSQDSEQEELPR